MNTADKIAALFRNDGQCWSVGGFDWHNVVEANMQRLHTIQGVEVYQFPDGSAMVVMGDAWWTSSDAREERAVRHALMDAGYVVSASGDGWDLHPPGSTDEQIANGTVPTVVSGDWSVVAEPAQF